MGSAHSHLNHCYAIRDGKIDPWGTIRILADGVKDSGDFGDSSRTPLSVQTGLVVWSEKLVPYGNDCYRARVTENTVQVYGTSTVGNSFVEEIPHHEFLIVKVSEAVVHDDGHLESFCSGPDRFGWEPWKSALRQAAAGERPGFLDNSPFTQVDEKFAGQRVIELSWGLSLLTPAGYGVAVFTKSGERISSKVHWPLSYAKWEPTSKYAAYSVQESSTN